MQRNTWWDTSWARSHVVKWVDKIEHDKQLIIIFCFLRKTSHILQNSFGHITKKQKHLALHRTPTATQMSHTPTETVQSILNGIENLHNLLQEQFAPEHPPHTSNGNDNSNGYRNRRPRRHRRTNRRRSRQPRQQHPYTRHEQHANLHTRWQTNRERFCQEIGRDMRHELTTDDADTIYMHVGHKTGYLQQIEDELETPVSGRSMHQRLATLCRRNINHLVEQRHRVGGARVNSGDMELIVNYV